MKSNQEHSGGGIIVKFCNDDTFNDLKREEEQDQWMNLCSLFRFRQR